MNTKLKISLLGGISVIFLFFSSCKKQIEDNNLQEEFKKSHVIALPVALKKLDVLLSEIEGNTKSRRRSSASVDNVIVLGKDGLNNKNKKSHGNDTLLYIVEFEDDMGCAVLSADYRIGIDVFAITDRGSLLDHQEPPISMIDTSIFINEDGYEDYYCYGASIGSSLLNNIQIVAIQRRDLLDPVDHLNGAIGTTIKTIVRPLLKTLWQQYSPFNNKCPKFGAYRAPAGCVAIALAQIMAYHEYPTNPLANQPSSWNWTGVKEIYKLGTLSPSLYSGSEIDRNSVATFVHDIGEDCNMTYSIGGSGATFYRAKQCLKHYGYKNVHATYCETGFSTNENNKIINSLNNGCPVYMRGRNKSGGHAWVIDGYIHRITIDGKYLYHCNFGWSGEDNGYYVAEIHNAEFNTASGPDVTDPAYGDRNDNPDGYNFVKKFAIITYNKPN
ncbi:MAG: C10 family peptidase [Bacteroidales bacterium]|jgi:hypothetical protein|nr:C10 family peptidase [Bacteroidales bacterium]